MITNALVGGHVAVLDGCWMHVVSICCCGRSRDFFVIVVEFRRDPSFGFEVVCPGSVMEDEWGVGGNLAG